MIPCNFASELRAFEDAEVMADLAAEAIAEDAQDSLCGDCAPYLADNITEALDNLVHLQGFQSATLPALSAASKAGDAAEFGRLMLAAIENYWIAEAMVIAQRQFERSH
jgi:hypothetical protein